MTAPTALAPLLAGSRDGLRHIADTLSDTIAASRPTQNRGPLPGGSPEKVLDLVLTALGPAKLPTQGIGGTEALQRIAAVLGEWGIDLAHPHAAAHLQPPPLTLAVAADVLASVGNASLDTYDSGPATIGVERWLITALAGLAGLGPRADGVLTPGGSLSNLLALLLARDAAATRLGVDVRANGVGALPAPVVLCSRLAHFSVHRACAALGLGENAVRAVDTDEHHRMRPEALAEVLSGLRWEGSTPVAIIATAGTTDFGSVDPLPQLAEIASEYGIWLHVDAAYGFGALFSPHLSGRLDGIELADSVTLDLHKIGWQPAAASVLLVADPGSFTALDREVAYLNPGDDADAGLDGLLGRSLQTTRRPDAVKMTTTLLAYGREGLGRLVDTCHGLARYAARRILVEPELELIAPAELTTVVFRYRSGDPARLDELNGALRRLLLETGEALIGRTTVRLGGPDAGERVCLKFTLLNPTATTDDIDRLVDLVLAAGRRATEGIHR